MSRFIRVLIFFLSWPILVSCADSVGDVRAESVSDGEVVKPLYVGDTWPSNDIPVCWEDVGYESEKEWVLGAVSNTNLTLPTNREV